MRRHVVFLVACFAVGLIVLWPAMRAAWLDDDYAQLGVVAGVQPRPMAARGPLDVYRFFSGDEADGVALRDLSSVPWWFAPATKMAFFRPLTSLTMLADTAFGANARETHAHSLLWVLVLLLAAWTLFRCATPESATWATLLLALSRLGTPAATWCHRHVLVSATFGCLAVAAHVVWRRGGMRGVGWISPLLLALALAGGESGVDTIAFLVAYEIVGASGSSRERLAAALRPGSVVVVYLVAVRAMGYGAAHEELYTDPLANPGRYLHALINHLPATVQRLATAEVDGLARRVSHGFVLACTVAIDAAWVYLALRSRAFARTPEGRAAIWLLLGGLLSLPVILASPANALTLPIVGTCAAVGALARRALVDLREKVTVGGVLGGAAAAILLFAHGWASPYLAHEAVSKEAVHQTDVHRLLLEAPIRPEQRDVLVFTASWSMWAWGTGLRIFRPDTHVEHWWPISMEARDLDVVRVDRHALEVSAASERPIVSHDWFRSAEFPWGAGERIVMKGLEVRILEAVDGRVTRVRLTLDRDLDAGEVALLVSDGQHLDEVAVPPVGARVALRAGRAGAEGGQ